MTINGTAAYDRESELPALVERALAVARSRNFTYSCLPAHGRLLRVLAGGAKRIGETGTGCGVGLAWLASGAPLDATITSIERDPDNARAAAEALSGDKRVAVKTGDALELLAEGPFDLLVLDGGPGSGKTGEPPLDPARWLLPGGTVVIDDFTPMAGWPPRIGDTVDSPRLHWLDHPLLRTTEIRLTPEAATLVGRYLGVNPETS